MSDVEQKREKSTYWGEGLCKNGCIALALIAQGKKDGSLKGKEGAQRIQSMKTEAKTKGCPEV